MEIPSLQESLVIMGTNGFDAAGGIYPIDGLTGIICWIYAAKPSINRPDRWPG